MNDKKLGVQISSDKIKELELEMLIYIDSVCRKHGIRYSLFAGTLLGAVRHKGFIPWDDDIDICVPMPDYDKLLDLLRDSKEYLIRCDRFDPKYSYWHAKLVNPKTIAIEAHKPFDKKMGVWVDIFPICGIPSEKTNKQFLNELDELNERVFASINNNYMYGGGKIIKTAAKAILKLPYGIKCKIKGTEFWTAERRKLYQSQPFESADKVGIVPLQYGEKTIYPKDYFDNYTTVTFENHMFMCAEKWHEFLRDTYGDYMTLPPVEKRVPTHFEAYWKS